MFLFVRAFATAVTVYSIAIVTDLISGIGFFWSVVLLGVFTVVYDAIGGIKGVVYSDVLQMFILVGVGIAVYAAGSRILSANCQKPTAHPTITWR